MIFTKDLLLKGLAGLAVCGGATTIGVHYYTGGFSSSSSEVKVTEGDLGLPEGCTFSGAITTPCNLTADNIKNIRFEGKSDNQTINGEGTLATLRITIPGNDEKDIFPFGYKVTITASPGDITITRSSGNIVLKANQATDFKIKQNAKTFSLEKAWTAEDLAKKVGLEKSNDHWTVGSKAIKVKYESGNAESKTASSAREGVTQGKIKAYTETTVTTYNKGIKFVIEDGDIALTNGDAGTSITKLEQFETYEIKEESGSWILIRKSKAINEIKTLLGLPANESDCTEVERITECSLDEAKIRNIKFEGKGNDSVTVTEGTTATMKLKISKTTATNKEKFPHGHKFILESNKDITIPQSGRNPSSITIKKDTNTEFKIKKGEGNNWTLEKAWTVEELAAKVGLTGCTTGDTSPKQCDFGSSISVYESENKKVIGATITAGKKITFELDQEDHNQGIKFYIPDSETADISITGGTSVGNAALATTISKRTSSTTGPTYEIKEVSGTWYLAKKS